MGHHNSDINAAFYQNGTSIVNMDSNHPNKTNMNALNASSCYSTMEILKGSHFSREIPSEKSSKQYSQGKWTQIEEKLYDEFVKLSLIKYPGIDLRHSERKRRFYFNAMSSFIGTRSSVQCRSHDQKVREKLRFSSKRASPHPRKPMKKNHEQEGDDMMIDFEDNHHMDMMPSRGMMKQITEMAIEPAKKKPDSEDVDRFFNFGSQEHQQGSGANNDQGSHYRSVGFNSEFGRSYSFNDENFNLNFGC